MFKYGACVGQYPEDDPSLLIFLFSLDDDECLRGNSICPTNSFCRNTPGSYAVRLPTLLNRADNRRSSVIVSLVTKCWLNGPFAKVIRSPNSASL